jgi:hypothetical protein
MSLQGKMTLYKGVLYSVIVLSTAALIAEILPEVSAKMLVIPTLLLIIGVCVVDLFRLRNDPVYR